MQGFPTSIFIISTFHKSIATNKVIHVTTSKCRNSKIKQITKVLYISSCLKKLVIFKCGASSHPSVLIWLFSV